MQSAWVAFAQTGDPWSSRNQRALEKQSRPGDVVGPGWPEYSEIENLRKNSGCGVRLTMVFGGGSLGHVVDDPMKAEREAVDRVIGQERQRATLGLH